MRLTLDSSNLCDLVSPGYNRKTKASDVDARMKRQMAFEGFTGTGPVDQEAKERVRVKAG